ncbi:MAG: PP2C family protein-serine/threonine phosphatase [Desulfohalobiaceae bacterium]
MQNTGIKILITDDSPGWREDLNNILHLESYQLFLAENGEQAVHSYLLHKPEIILLDLNLPGLNGLEVIDYIRNQANDTDIYIISITSEDDPDKKSRALNLGANDFLLKPFAAEELKARLNVAKRQLRLNQQLRQAYQRIAREIDTVASLQVKLLPKECVSRKDISVQTLYRPSGRASGDYYDFFPIDENTLRVVIADVSGHGARAAFLMAMVRALIRSSESHFFTLAQSLHLVNKQLCEIIGNEPDFVTLFVADVNNKEGSLTYINAGHCPGILSTSVQDCQLLQPTHTILGFFDLEFQPTKQEISGDSTLLLFTDGFYEWDISPGVQYGLENFISLASDLICRVDLNLPELEQYMMQDMHFKPSFRDDRSALLIRWGG